MLKFGMLETREAVHRLVGPIQPTGVHDLDTERLENLKTMVWVIDALLTDVYRAAKDADDSHQSEKLIGDHARLFLARLEDFHKDLQTEGKCTSK